MSETPEAYSAQEKETEAEAEGVRPLSEDELKSMRRNLAHIDGHAHEFTSYTLWRTERDARRRILATLDAARAELECKEAEAAVLRAVVQRVANEEAGNVIWDALLSDARYVIDNKQAGAGLIEALDNWRAATADISGVALEEMDEANDLRERLERSEAGAAALRIAFVDLAKRWHWSHSGPRGADGADEENERYETCTVATCILNRVALDEAQAGGELLARLEYLTLLSTEAERQRKEAVARAWDLRERMAAFRPWVEYLNGKWGAVEGEVPKPEAPPPGSFDEWVGGLLAKPGNRALYEQRLAELEGWRDSVEKKKRKSKK